MALANIIKCLLSMCDIQIWTGLGILVSGYATLALQMSAYHWQIIVYLAWFSNLTHISALIHLRGYLGRNKAWAYTWRLVSMSTLFALLFCALVPTGFFNWENDLVSAAQPASYALCFYNYTFGRRLFDSVIAEDSAQVCTLDDGTLLSLPDCSNYYFSRSSAFQSMCLSMVLLTAGFFTRLFKLVVPKPSLRAKFSMDRLEPSGPIVKAILVLLYFFWHLPSSMISEVRWFGHEPNTFINALTYTEYLDLLTQHFIDLGNFTYSRCQVLR